MILLKNCLAVLLGLVMLGNAQTIMKDYTFTDITGTSHHLYEYLNDGKWLALFFTKPGD